MRRKSNVLTGGRDAKGVQQSFDLRLSLPKANSFGPSSACPQHSALHYLTGVSTPMTSMSFLSFVSFSFFFISTSIQMNAYTAALSVALFYCCVLTSSWSNVHSEQRFTPLVKSLCSLQRFHSKWLFYFMPIVFFKRLFFKWFYISVLALMYGSKCCLGKKRISDCLQRIICF